MAAQRACALPPTSPKKGKEISQAGKLELNTSEVL